jgi:hypothetical protein
MPDLRRIERRVDRSAVRVLSLILAGACPVGASLAAAVGAERAQRFGMTTGDMTDAAALQRERRVVGAAPVADQL